MVDLTLVQVIEEEIAKHINLQATNPKPSCLTLISSIVKKADTLKGATSSGEAAAPQPPRWRNVGDVVSVSTLTRGVP